MQIHSVVPVSDNQIAVRKVSCYFMQCLECVRETTCAIMLSKGQAWETTMKTAEMTISIV